MWQHVKANVKKRPSLYGFGNIKQLELWSSGKGAGFPT